METITYKIASPLDERLKEAGELLKNGGLCAIPTETVYGLAANALNGEVVEKIYTAKGRPSDNPLIVHISRLSQWGTLVKEIPQKAMDLAKAYWPGPLTIILEKSNAVPLQVSGGLSTVAVRMPSNEIARAVIDNAGVPLAAPSANTSGKPSPTTAHDVYEDLNGKIEMIIDGGSCSVGVESTVITLVGDKPRLLRPGAVTPEMLEKVLGEIEIDPAVLERLAQNAVAASPGMKYKHYSPKASVIILKGTGEKYRQYIKSQADESTVALCFDEDLSHLEGYKTLSFGSENDSASQCERIFEALREVDRMGAKKAYARFPDISGMGLAVFNRLVRAAAFNIVELD